MTERRPGKRSRNPKLIAGLLLVGTLLIGGGSVFAATRPTWSPPPAGTAMAKSRLAADTRSSTRPIVGPGSAIEARVEARAVRAERPAAETAPKDRSRTTPATASSPPITYTVKVGDTLSGIAEWFRLHGYGALYQANMAVIGADPNLIFPGQRITIADGTMSMRGAAGDEGQGR